VDTPQKRRRRFQFQIVRRLECETMLCPRGYTSRVIFLIAAALATVRKVAVWVGEVTNRKR